MIDKAAVYRRGDPLIAAMGRAHAIVPRVQATATDIPKRPRL